MATDKRQFTLRLNDDNFDKIKIIADKNKRSITMQIEYLIELYISDYEKLNGELKIKEEDPL